MSSLSAATSPPMSPSSAAPSPPASAATVATPAPVVAAASSASAAEGQSPSQLATLLAQAYADLDTAHAERDAAQARADSLLADNLASSSINADTTTDQQQQLAQSTIAALQATNDAKQRAIDDLTHKLRAIVEAWGAYERWMSNIEVRGQDARRAVGALVANTSASGINPEEPLSSPRGLPPTQPFQLPSPLGNRRPSRPSSFVYPNPPNSLTAQMQQIPPGAPGGPPTSQSGAPVNLPLNLPPIPSGVVAGRIRPREPSPLPTPRRHSNEDEQMNEPPSASSEGERHRMKRLRPDPSSSRREKERFTDSPRSATAQMSPHYSFSSAQQQAQSQHQQSGAGPEYPPQQQQGGGGYPRAGKPRTPQYDGVPPPQPPPRFSNSSSQHFASTSPSGPHAPPPLHIGSNSNDRDHHHAPQTAPILPYGGRGGYGQPYQIRRESDQSTLISAVTPTSAATTASARSSGSNGMMVGGNGKIGSRDSYTSPYSATTGSRTEYVRQQQGSGGRNDSTNSTGEEIFENVGVRTDSPPPMMVLDPTGNNSATNGSSARMYENSRRRSSLVAGEGNDEDAMKRREQDRQRQLKQRHLLRVDVAPTSKRDGRRRSSGGTGEDEDMHDGEGERDPGEGEVDNEDKDSVDEFLINTAINVDDEHEQDELRDDHDHDHDHDPEDPRRLHHHHTRGISPTSPVDDRMPSRRESSGERERERWKERDRQRQLELERRLRPHQIPYSATDHPQSQQQHLAAMHHQQQHLLREGDPHGTHHQFYATNGLVKTKGERSGDVFRHYSTPGNVGGGGGQGTPGHGGGYSPQQTYAYPRSPEGGPGAMGFAGRRVTVAGQSLPTIGEGVGGGGVEYVQQPSGRAGTSLHHIPTPISSTSFDFSPQTQPQSATSATHPHPHQGHLRRHSSSSTNSPTTATSLPSVNSLMFPTSATHGPAPPRHAGPGPAVKPTFNEKGERICRACGQPGRYRDGKCVEKWGPGPAGPGTVCDRCRKKMKRVERRGTIEAEMARRLPEQYYTATTTQPHPVPPLQLHPGTDGGGEPPPQQHTPIAMNHQTRMYHFQPPLTAATSSSTWSHQAVKAETGGGVPGGVRHGRSGSLSGVPGASVLKPKAPKERERRRAPSFSPSPPPPPISSETRRKSIGSGDAHNKDVSAASIMETAAADLMGMADSPAATTLKDKEAGDGEGEEEDGDGEEEEDAMGEEEDDIAMKAAGGGSLPSSKSPAMVTTPPHLPPAPPSATRPTKDSSNARSPRPGWVKLEDDYGGDDESATGEPTSGAVAAAS